MGRIAGVTAEETRQRLLDTAAEVFGRMGYDGASIAQISSEAGLSSGAIYAHYAGKAELFVATLRAHAQGEFEQLVGHPGARDLAGFLRARGEALQRRTPAERTLLIEAVVAAKRHPEVAAVLRGSFGDREAQLRQLVDAAQVLGEIAPDLSADAVVRFVLMTTIGSLVVSALGLPAVDAEGWVALVGRLVDNIRTTSSRED